MTVRIGEMIYRGGRVLRISWMRGYENSARGELVEPCELGVSAVKIPNFGF
jgi:hypothetical protein